MRLTICSTRQRAGWLVLASLFWTADCLADRPADIKPVDTRPEDNGLTKRPAGQAKPVTLHWQAALAQTLAKNPSLVAAGLQREAEAGRLQQAGLRSNPELALAVEDALGSGAYNGWERGQTNLSISWVLDASLRQQRLNSAQARAQVAQVDYAIAQLDAAAATARSYINLLALQARFEQSAEAVSRAEEVVQMVEQRVKAGKCPNAELAVAKVDLSQHVLAQDDIEHELAIARRYLAAQWGETEPSFTRVAGEIFKLPTAASFTELKLRAENNPRLQRLATLKRYEASRLALAQAERKPQWKVSMGVKHLAESDDHALLAGVSVPLGVFDRNQGRIQEARANLAASEADEVAEQVRMDAAMFALHQELLHNLHIAQSYTSTILPQLERATSQTRQAYEMGQYTYSQWQSVQSQWLAAKEQQINTSAAAMLKAIELERLTGVALSPQGQVH